MAGVKAGCVHVCRVAGNTDPIWHVTLCSREMDFCEAAIHAFSFTLALQCCLSSDTREVVYCNLSQIGSSEFT